MAGHSKWANIKHKKAISDNKKGKLFTRLIREISIAAKNSMDIHNNPNLRQAIDKAKEANISKDTIQKAISQSSKDTNSLEAIIYEGYASQGVAILIYCLTDNKVRTVANVRHTLSKYSGHLGSSGAVGYLFKQYAHFVFSPSDRIEDTLLEISLEHDVEDIVSDEGGYVEMFCHPNSFPALQDVFLKHKITPDLAEISLISRDKVYVSPQGERTILNLISALEELDDVQDVYTNTLWTSEE